MKNNKWVRLLAYVAGSVNQELLLRNEYLAAENRVLRAKLPTRLRLGRKAFREVACVAKPDTILAWNRRLVSGKVRRLKTPLERSGTMPFRRSIELRYYFFRPAIERLFGLRRR